MKSYDISTLENVLRGIIRDANVSTTVYLNRPKATVGAKDEFVVVDVNGSLEDKNVYGRGTVYVYFFARDVQEEKNWKRLSLMYERFIAAMPLRSGRYIFDENPTLIGDVPDDYGFHARVLRMKVSIFHPDADINNN